MNVVWWRSRNWVHQIKNRLRHPPPFYKKTKGGIGAVVLRADGRKEDLGRIVVTYSRRWGVGSGQQ